MTLLKSNTFRFFVLALILTGYSCASYKGRIKKASARYTDAHQFENQFTGMMVYDPETRDTLVCHNCQKYFTPASNTKILTLFAGLRLLPDSLPALIYGSTSDTLFFKGTGYPASFHPELKDSLVYNFLKSKENLAVYLGNTPICSNGSGWAWDDFDQGYTPEMSSLPIYGNTARVINTNPPKIFPQVFTDSLLQANNLWRRAVTKNQFFSRSSDPDTVNIPIKISQETTLLLWEDTLNKPLQAADVLPEIPMDTLYGIPADSLYIPMMHQSDNFLAEQILLMVSAQLQDTLSIRTAIDTTLDNLLPDLRQPPRWVDGSGLSRYNLISPECLVYVLNEMYGSVAQERLFALFPAGGLNGTLESWYKGDQQPYVFAKTGSLGNNHNLSGYLKTKSGKILIFSIMNNHYRIPTQAVKQRMQDFLEQLRDSY